MADELNTSPSHHKEREFLDRLISDAQGTTLSSLTEDQRAWIHMMRELIAKDRDGDVITLEFLMSQAVTQGPGTKVGPLFTDEQVVAAVPPSAPELPHDVGTFRARLPAYQELSPEVMSEFMGQAADTSTGASGGGLRDQMDTFGLLPGTTEGRLISGPPGSAAGAPQAPTGFSGPTPSTSYEPPADFVAEGYNPPAPKPTTEPPADFVAEGWNPYTSSTGPTRQLSPLAQSGVPLEDNIEGNVPNGYQLWQVDGKPFIVYFVPNTNPPVPLMWEIRTDEMKDRIVGPNKPYDFHEVLTQSDMFARGGIPMGGATEIAEFDQDPFTQFADTFGKEAEIRPWLRDPEILALTVGAMLEGRDVTDAELFTTNWYQTHNEAERAWLELNAQDPATAQSRVEGTRRTVAKLLEDSGMLNPPEALVNFLSAQGITGAWESTYVDQQIRKLADPLASGELDAQLQSFVDGGLDTTRGEEERVRALANQWLGPAYVKGWDEEWFKKTAGMLRNDPDGETRLIEQLRAQRLAMFPEYENPELTYQDIAGPWKQVYSAAWGQQADETDPFFNSIVRMNDLDAATKLLTTEGMKRGVGTVVNNALGDLSRVTGSSVRQADRGIL